LPYDWSEFRNFEAVTRALCSQVIPVFAGDEFHRDSSKSTRGILNESYTRTMCACERVNVRAVSRRRSTIAVRSCITAPGRELQGHVAVQHLVVRQPDHPHSTVPDNTS
jgi:hypothetical protein